MIAIRRAYDGPAPDDGSRVLVDRLWPRGRSERDAAIERPQRCRGELDAGEAGASLTVVAGHGPTALITAVRGAEPSLLRDWIARRAHTVRWTGGQA